MKDADKKTEVAKKPIWPSLRMAVLRFWNGPTLVQGDPKPPGPVIVPSAYQRGRIDLETTKSIEDFNAKWDALEEEARKVEALAITRAELALTKESLQRNLTLTHRSVAISMLTSVIALAALIVAITQPDRGTTQIEIVCSQHGCFQRNP